MILLFELLLIYSVIREEHELQVQGQTWSYFPIKINIKFITLSGHSSQMKPLSPTLSRKQKILIQKINPPKQINQQKMILSSYET